MANVRYASSKAGIAKIVTIIFGMICVGLTAYAYDRVWKEEVFLGFIVACLVISLLLFIIYLLAGPSSDEGEEVSRSSKIVDSGFHFIAGLLLLIVGALMIYSAVDLWNHWKYFCSYGIDRGVPCIYDTSDKLFGNRGYTTRNNNYNSIYGYNSGQQQQQYGSYGLGTNNYYDSSYNNGQQQYYRGSYDDTLGSNNGDGTGRTFINPLGWLKGVNVYEECRRLLPRLTRCNEYFELKLAAGILGLLNGIIYGVTGVVVLIST